ncbi:hypothetical protein ACX0G7_27175 [Flavitalea antarctica]
MNLFFALLVLTQNVGTIHKDRLSIVSKVTFHTTDQHFFRFVGKDSVQLRRATDSLTRNRTFQKVEVLFSTGEKAEFRGNGVKWIAISIHSNNQVLVVSLGIVSKIREIHFDDMFLLWSGEKETAFKSEYLNLVFASGIKRIYGQFPKTQLLCFKLAKWAPEVATPIEK